MTSAKKLILVPDPRPVEPGVRVRRYRLARLTLNPCAAPADRHEHLKRVYD